jgi:hypothetical protein
MSDVQSDAEGLSAIDHQMQELDISEDKADDLDLE